MHSTPACRRSLVGSAAVTHPLGLRRAGVIAICAYSLLGAGHAAAGSLDAGASTFESAARRYRATPIRDEDIRIPHVRTEAETAVTAPAGPLFRIDRFDVTGNTLLSLSDVDAVLAPFRGEGRSLDDVQKARDALQHRYEQDGFVTVAVAIPQQTIESGAVRLEVVEARLGAVTVRNEGVHWVSDRRIEGELRHTVPGAVVRQEDLQDDLVRANRWRDAHVRPELKAGQKPGEVDVAMIVDDNLPLHGTLAYHNDHTEGSPDTRMDAALSYTNLWGLGHEIGGFYQFVPSSDFSDVQIWGGTYRMPMPWSEDQNLFAYYAKSDTTNAAATGGGLAVLGKGTTTGGRYVVALPALRDWKITHELSIGVDYKDIQNAVTAPGVELVTPITYMPFTVAWSGTRVGDQAIHDGRLGLSFNFAGMVEGGSKNDFQINRGGLDPTSDVTGDYQIVSLSLGQILRVPAILTTLAAGHFLDLPVPAKSFADDWTFDLRARGQIATQPLVATEQIGIGGTDSVRGYLDREKTGDNGYVLEMELHTPSYRNFLGGRFREQIQGTLFWDNAEVWLYEDPASPRMHSRLESFGVGVRAGFFETISTELFLAEPMIETESSSGPRLHFRVALGF